MGLCPLEPREFPLMDSLGQSRKDWYVYILFSEALNRLYTGITLDLERRVQEHNTSPRGAKATRAGRPWRLVYHETFTTKGDALRRELAIKALPRARKMALLDKS
jgi:putative endonuclease